jgi:hypothetical protein
MKDSHPQLESNFWNISTTKRGIFNLFARPLAIVRYAEIGQPRPIDPLKDPGATVLGSLIAKA